MPPKELVSHSLVKYYTQEIFVFWHLKESTWLELICQSKVQIALSTNRYSRTGQVSALTKKFTDGVFNKMSAVVDNASSAFCSLIPLKCSSSCHNDSYLSLLNQAYNAIVCSQQHWHIKWRFHYCLKHLHHQQCCYVEILLSIILSIPYTWGETVNKAFD